MKKRILLFLLALLLIGCHKPAPQPEATVPAEAGERAFHFTTIDLDGNTVTDAAFSGYDLVMLNFWAYWCGPCVREIPELQKLHEAHPNVLLLGVIVDDSDMDETRRILTDAGATYPVVYPSGDLLELANQCQYIPTTFFYDADGNARRDPVIGGNDLAGWTDIVEALLP